MVKLRKSNILAPKHGGDGVILASVTCLADVRGPYYSGQWGKRIENLLPLGLEDDELHFNKRPEYA